MICAYHPRNPAVVQCNGCGRPLCPACDHRIRGFPFCQDCIVAGVEMLRLQPQSSAAPIIRRKSSPLVATLLSICPGLGAAYNGQTSKAIVQFAIFASFFQMSIVTDGMLLFILGFAGTWLFAAVDACRTAQLMRAGLASDAAEDVVARRLYGNPLAWSLTLLVIGVVFVLRTMFDIRLPVQLFLSVLLIGLGIYILADWVRRRTKLDRGSPAFDTHHPPPSVVSAPLDSARFRTGELVTHVSAREVRRLPFEPRP
jgi:hypothetical protein